MTKSSLAAGLGLGALLPILALPALRDLARERADPPPSPPAAAPGRALGLSLALVRDGQIVRLPYVPLAAGTERVVLDVRIDEPAPIPASEPTSIEAF